MLLGRFQPPGRKGGSRGNEWKGGGGPITGMELGEIGIVGRERERERERK